MNCLLALAALLAVTSADSKTWTDRVSSFTQRHYKNQPHHKLAKPMAVAFNCSVEKSPTTPTSVHQLRPADINVIGAIGDSMTAAFAAEATSILNYYSDYRGASWTVGGDDDLATLSTLPNILKQFNPELYGFSTGKGGATTTNAVFNQAITGAIAAELSPQVDALVGRMASNENINFNEDWKVVSIWIGGNDLCDVCNGAEVNTPSSYVAYLDEAITKIITQIPRVYVNMISIIDVARLAEIDVGDCTSWHNTLCPCATKGPEDVAKITAAALEYQRLTAELVAQPRFHSDTYTVEFQPFLIDTQIPTLPDGEPDVSYLALDCFHFDLKSHGIAGAALWNNMLQPPNAKSLTWNINPELICPTAEAPYLCTESNNCGRV